MTVSPEPTQVANVADCDSAVFLEQWLRTPGQIGAIAPSSSRLAHAISTAIPEHGDPVVVELGAGTGPFTAEIQGRLAGRGRHLAVEINPKLAQLLRDRFTQTEVIEGDACLLPSLLDERGLRHADVVISSLPWTIFEPAAQDLLLKAVLDVLAPHSVFCTRADRDHTQGSADDVEATLHQHFPIDPPKPTDEKLIMTELHTVDSAR